MAPILDPLKIVTKDSEFSTSNWKNRRFIIKSALLYCMLAFSAIIVSVIVLMYIKPEYRYDQNITGILSTALTTLGFLTISIIGSYVFGAQWDTNSYRSSIASITNPNPNSVNGPQTITNSTVINNPDDNVDPDSLSVSTVKRKSRIRRADNSTDAKG